MSQVAFLGLAAAASTPLLRGADVLAFVDTSDTAQSPQGSTVKVTLDDFFGAVPSPVVVVNGGSTPALTLQMGSVVAPPAALFGGGSAVIATDDSGGAFWHGLVGGGVGGGFGFTKFIGATSGGTLSAPTATQEGMVLAAFAGTGFGVNWPGIRGALYIVADDHWSATSHPTKLEFLTTPTGAIVPRTVGSIGSNGEFVLDYGASILDGAGHTVIAVAATSTLGFYGVTPVARPVLATGTGKTVDNVITALQTLGLVSQT